MFSAGQQLVSRKPYQLACNLLNWERTIKISTFDFIPFKINGRQLAGVAQQLSVDL